MAKTILGSLFMAGGLAAAALGLATATLGASPLLQIANDDGSPVAATNVRPLDVLRLSHCSEGSMEVRDGAGRIYYTAAITGPVSFRVGGALGSQEALVRNPAGAEVGRLRFEVDAATAIDDGGKYQDMFALFHRGMSSDVPGGVETTVWNGRTYRFFVNWVLDNYNTAKGMRYFSPAGTDFIDLMRQAQREDGMIWSNINPGDAVYYYETAYGPFGYVRKIGDRFFVRQPAENHPEALYVSTIYQSWKATGDDPWMRRELASAMRALDYSITDPARWSRRFHLLKRVYTIDSWDFEVDDAYTPDIGLTNTMLIDPEKSKFGVFFGDNVNYAAACEELAEMLQQTGDTANAAPYRARAADIRRQLDALSWNGRFFTHFIDEDPAVKRDLGVDEKTQLAQGNAYVLNQGIRQEQAAAIIKTYQDLRQHLPPGSPGEWYAIYPPFQRGFGRHDQVWQYMNGGVGGHVAGELARGALTHGFEDYGRDILDRLTALGHAHGDKIWFAYTGSIPPPPPRPRFTPIDLSPFANMDLTDQGGPGAAPWMLGGKRGDDVRGLPTGRQRFAGIDFDIADPQTHARKAVLALSHRPGLTPGADVPVHAKTGAIYLLHTASKPTSENVCGSVAFIYEDGTRTNQYIMMGRQLTYWWFSELKTDRSGIAWHGPSPVSADVGLSWCAIDNPHPEKPVAAIHFQAPEDDGIYAVAGLTLTDRPHYIPPSPVSFGGPDDWAAATAMAALVEGLAGVKDGPLSQAFNRPVLTPRWDLSVSRTIAVTVRYPASAGYVAYRYDWRADRHELSVAITGNATAIDCHFPLPSAADSVKALTVDGADTPYRLTMVGQSRYVDFFLDNTRPRTVRLRY